MGKLYMISLHNFCCIWLAICWMLLWSLTSAQSSDDHHVCGSLDIRNFRRNFKSLENCTIIEGSLQILLMDKTTPKTFENLRFPKLVEIRDFLLIYSVQGLLNLGSLLPNLSIIRGTNLFYNYALVIYEMESLKEIGLGNLTHIVRGSVRIEKNPNLCYVDTIDWNLIARAGKDGHFIKENQNVGDCHDICLHNGNDNLCPYSEEKELHLCWNRYSCQKTCSRVCEAQNRSCAQPEGCCHEECLGSCTGSDASDCIACKHVYHNGRCMSSCPSSLYQFNTRCITKKQCQQLPSPRNQPDNFYKPWKVDNIARSGQCSLDCPHGFMAVGKHSCHKCEKSCPKLCPGMKVDNLATAQRLHGCTAISGSLEIQLGGGGSNIYQELEKHLGKIETVDGYVKIIHSLPLTSLHFLSNLTLIKGNVLDRGEYSLVVRDNENLQDMWDWSQRNKKLTLRKGKPFFHFNPKLCYDTIKQTMQKIGVNEWDIIDISTTSNGNKGACDRVNLKLTVPWIHAEYASLLFDNFRKLNSDGRTVLSYIISYREVKEGQKVSLFEGRDACSDGSWKVEDTDASDYTDENEKIRKVLLGLTPDTHYAVHVRTSVIDFEQNSGNSDIVYFKTNPDKPTPPVDLVASHVYLDRIDLKWNPPLKPNGKVTHYIITWKQEPVKPDVEWSQNFCEDLPITLKKKPKKKKKIIVPKLSDTSLFKNDSCQCQKTPKLLEEDLKEQINFENYIHNAVYLKMKEQLSRRKRSIVDDDSFRNAVSTIGPTSERVSETPNMTSVSPTQVQVFSDVSSSTMFTVKHLYHYTKYRVEVKSCHNYDNNIQGKRCSTETVLYPKTKPRPGADDIDFSTLESRIDNNTSGHVFVQWQAPQSPNGIIDGYQIEYKRIDIENFKPITVCVPRQKFVENRGHALRGLAAGKYSMRLQAISLAGKGSWTKPTYFEIKEYYSGRNTVTIVVSSVVVAIILFGLIFLGVCWFFRKKYRAKMAASSLFTSVNPEYVSTFDSYVPDEWEIPRENITLIHELGQGTFGMVYEGTGKDVKTNEEYKCAIKTVNKTSSVREFLKEASVMKSFICHHVVRLIGIVSINQPTLVVMELMENGDLRNYLRSQRPDYEPVNDGKPKRPPTAGQFIQMAAEIADGMDYLATNKFVHRDLAARNCMVAKDLTVKIGDFGMTRDIYETDYYRKGGKGMLPVRWMAPESLKDGVFTSQSDVWSYGVVLWEMVTLACQPYQGLANEQVLKYVIDGGIIETPVNCDSKLYNIMRSCWQYNPKSRPAFSELVETLLCGVSENFKNVAFHFNKSVKQDNNSCADSEEDDELLSPSTPLHDSSNSNGAVVLPTSSKRTTDTTSTKGRFKVGSSKNNHSSNGYVPCDSTGSTYC